MRWKCDLIGADRAIVCPKIELILLILEKFSHLSTTPMQRNDNNNSNSNQNNSSDSSMVMAMAMAIAAMLIHTPQQHNKQ